ncbi:hypothetical protein OHA72_25620 [Dactylosporangium sp. NBC_01737]|uniref:hypothetical protein n=1 Tax=Dactylosporangium sp. NBC_01737 TaxID=2975959 RepID=UPI002E102776|nr:hypothetical protein OHA72_25620 [Dactylosporangium sp. NBC_01737]
MSRLTGLVLALYPRRLRDRYEQEIADLLASSRHPVRDLADVARCALAERVRALTAAEFRPHLHATAGLVAAPVAFAGGFLAVFAFLSLVVAVVVGGNPSPVAAALAQVLLASPVAPVAAGAVWLAGHTRRPAAAVLAPVTLTAGLLPLALLFTRPGTAWPAVLALGGWCVATSVLSAAGAASLRRGHRLRAALTVAVGGALACELAFTVYGLAVFGPSSWAFATYPVSVLGLDPGIIGDGTGQVAASVQILPAVLTVCTAYAAALTIRAGVARGPSRSGDRAALH